MKIVMKVILKNNVFNDIGFILIMGMVIILFII